MRCLLSMSMINRAVKELFVKMTDDTWSTRLHNQQRTRHACDNNVFADFLWQQYTYGLYMNCTPMSQHVCSSWSCWTITWLWLLHISAAFDDQKDKKFGWLERHHWRETWFCSCAFSFFTVSTYFVYSGDFNEHLEQFSVLHSSI